MTATAVSIDRMPPTRKEARELNTRARALIAMGQVAVGESLLAVAQAAVLLSKGKRRGKPSKLDLLKRSGAFPKHVEADRDVSHLRITTPWWVTGSKPPEDLVPVRMSKPHACNAHKRGQVAGVLIGPETIAQREVWADYRGNADAIDIQASIDGDCMARLSEYGPTVSGRRKSRRERGSLTNGQRSRVSNNDLTVATRKAQRRARHEAFAAAREAEQDAAAEERVIAFLQSKGLA